MTGQWTFSLASLSNRSACARTANGAQHTSWRCEQLNFDWYNQQVIQRKNGNSNVYSASLLLRFLFICFLIPLTINSSFVPVVWSLGRAVRLRSCCCHNSRCTSAVLDNVCSRAEQWHKFQHLFESSAIWICLPEWTIVLAHGTCHYLLRFSSGAVRANRSCRFEKMRKFVSRIP